MIADMQYPEGATPLAFGPRNCGQSAARANAAAMRRPRARIAGLYLDWFTG